MHTQNIRGAVVFLGLIASLYGCGTDRDGGGRLPVADGGTDAQPRPDGGVVDSGGTVVDSPLVDPQCVDGQYTETLPNPNASIADLTPTYSQANLIPFLTQVLERRYPFVAPFMLDGSNGPGQTQCVPTYVQEPGTAAGVLRGIETTVHECGHVVDLEHRASFRSNVYFIKEGLQFECSGGDTTTRGGMTFARSRIRNDAYQAAWPACQNGQRGCDIYTDVYLDGNPDDNVFDGGDQGFNMLLEEVVQYVNSLATVYAFQDQMPATQSTSGKDGILTLLWYMERYLHMARLEYPTAYQALISNECWREAVLTVWGRAWLYLETTRSLDRLGINEDRIEPLVKTPELLEEIERIRTAHGC